jgi:outer membrane protein OmpA-like peptidoglycan-associated protein
MGMNQLVKVIIWTVILIPHPLVAQNLIQETQLDSLSVFFESGSFGIKNTNQLLKRFNQFEKTKLGRIQVTAYTDSVGTRESNKLLASARLQSVLKILSTSNLNDYNIDTLNKNELHENSSVENENFRRVDLLIYKLEPNYTYGKPINLNIQFHAGSDHVMQSSYESMKQLLYVMKSNDSLRIQLNGHVCCMADQPLSLSRAKRVKSFLVLHGIDGKRIACLGYSNSVKLVEEITPKEQEINRRVEVIFLKN